MQTRVNYNAREQIAAPKQQLESQEKAEDWESECTASNFCLYSVSSSSSDHSMVQDQYNKLSITHHNYQKATKAQITSLTRKLKETERKLNELQNCFLGTDNSEDTTVLMSQLLQSETKVKELEANNTHLEKTIKDMTEEHHMLARQFSDTNLVSERTINELKKQLAEARSPRNLKEQSTAAVQTAAVLSAEPSRRATKASQADFRSAKEADLELKCGKQQAQIHQLQQQLQLQLQESQKQLEEQAIQHRQEREKFQSEMNEVKSLLTNYKNLHAFYPKVMEEEKEEKSSMGTPLEKAEAEKEFLPQTVEPLQKKQDVEKGKEGKVDLVLQTSLSLQEPAEEKQGTEQEKEVPQTSSSLQEPAEDQSKAGKGDSLLETVRSLQESLKTEQGNEKILTTKLEKLEEQPKQKKKKKRNWLLRLFSRIKS